MSDKSIHTASLPGLRSPSSIASTKSTTPTNSSKSKQLSLKSPLAIKPRKKAVFTNPPQTLGGLAAQLVSDKSASLSNKEHKTTKLLDVLPSPKASAATSAPNAQRKPNRPNHREPPVTVRRPSTTPGSISTVTKIVQIARREEEENSKKVEEIRKTLEDSFKSATRQQQISAQLKKKRLQERLQKRRQRAQLKLQNAAKLGSAGPRPTSSPSGTQDNVFTDSIRPNTTTGHDRPSAASNSAWVMYYDEYNNPYYYNVETATSQWERPAGFNAEKSGESLAYGTDDQTYSTQNYYDNYGDYSQQDQSGYDQQYDQTQYYNGDSQQYYAQDSGYSDAQYDHHHSSPTTANTQSAETKQKFELLKKKMQLKLKQEERQMKKKMISLNRQLKQQATQQDSILSEMQLELESEIQTGLMQQQQLQELQRKLAEVEREKEEHARIAYEAQKKLVTTEEAAAHRQSAQDYNFANEERPYSPEAVARRYNTRQQHQNQDRTGTLTVTPIATESRSRQRFSREGKTNHQDVHDQQTHQSLSEAMAIATKAANAMSARPGSRASSRQESKQRSLRQDSEEVGLLPRRGPRRQRQRQRQSRESKSDRNSQTKKQKPPKKKKSNFLQSIAKLFAPTSKLTDSDDDDADTSSSGDESTASFDPDNELELDQSLAVTTAVPRSPPASADKKAISPVFRTKSRSGSGTVSMETDSTALASMNTLVLDWQTRHKKRLRHQRSSSGATLSTTSASRPLTASHHHRYATEGDLGEDWAFANSSSPSQSQSASTHTSPLPISPQRIRPVSRQRSNTANAPKSSSNPNACPICGAGAGALRWKHCNCNVRLALVH